MGRRKLHAAFAKRLTVSFRRCSCEAFSMPASPGPDKQNVDWGQRVRSTSRALPSLIFSHRRRRDRRFEQALRLLKRSSYRDLFNVVVSIRKVQRAARLAKPSAEPTVVALRKHRQTAALKRRVATHSDRRSKFWLRRSPPVLEVADHQIKNRERRYYWSDEDLPVCRHRRLRRSFDRGVHDAFSICHN